MNTKEVEAKINFLRDEIEQYLPEYCRAVELGDREGAKDLGEMLMISIRDIYRIIPKEVNPPGGYN